MLLLLRRMCGKLLLLLLLLAWHCKGQLPWLQGPLVMAVLQVCQCTVCWRAFACW
jgi:hypothetical protein